MVEEEGLVSSDQQTSKQQSRKIKKKCRLLCIIAFFATKLIQFMALLLLCKLCVYVT